MKNEPFHYIIVGAGSAGCVLANRLSKDPNVRVLLLEAGNADRNFWLRFPIGFFRTIYDERFSRIFDTEPSEGTSGRAITWPRGRVLGGTSSINGLVFIRGQHEDFDDWENLGAKGWGFDSVLNSFKSIENYRGGADYYRGINGGLQVSKIRDDNPACAAWLEAAQSYGLPRNRDFNGDSTYGVGSFQLTIGRNWRSSSSAAFLRPVRERKNLVVRTGAFATRVVFEGRKAVGVEYQIGGVSKIERVENEVILSAGSIQSPQLLQLSGIGESEHLKSLGIPVVSNLPGVGKNLQDHYMARMVLNLCRPGSINMDTRNLFKLSGMALNWVLRGRGLFTVGGAQVGGGAMTKYARDGRPDIQFSISPLSVGKPGDPLHKNPGFTASVWQCHPKSRGDVRIRSADPLEAPDIRPNYFKDPFDRKVIVEAIKILRGIHREPPFQSYWNEEISPGPQIQSDDDIFSTVSKFGGSVFHGCGTCRAGEDELAVVDSKLRVHGVSNLRIADASIMPKITSTNTNAPSLMIGERAASLILASSPIG